MPPRWSPHDWFEEVRAIADVAFYVATCDFDPSRGIPFGQFARQRILTRELTRYRQEWVYAHHCAADDNANGWESLIDNTLFLTPLHQAVHEALSCLSQRHYWLIEQLFWEGRTEAEIGAVLGISQRGVSKRKQAVLAVLRQHLETPEKIR